LPETSRTTRPNKPVSQFQSFYFVQHQN
jgi:hypothetical protein